MQDTTPPTLTPVSDQTDEATGPNGAVATFAASASDIVDGSDPVTFTEGDTVVHSGDTFCLGTHTITASATDQAGNTGSESFTITVRDTTPPVLGNDGNAVMAFQAVVGTSVLGNDSDVATGPVHVTGISDASHGAGSVGGSLAGQYGTLTFNLDGSYRYVADNAAALSEGQVVDDVFTYAATDQNGNSATATLDIKVTGHSGGAMEVVSYTAVESKTGDSISGVLYDNSGRYTVGSSVTVAGPDNLGGSWTYTVDNIGRADIAHQDVSYSGLAYDFDYRDADTGTVYSTFYGHAGFDQGIADKVNFSGSNGLGSDGDLILVNGRFFGIASGKYVLPEGAQASGPSLMKAVTFQAQESVTGDVINGVLFDNAGHYSVGSSVSTGLDQLGGSWTYTVTSLADADARHQDASYENFVYDLTYQDADRGTVSSTFYGATGFSSGLNDRTANYSGNNGLGSDGDLVTVNGQFFGIASGKYVVPEPQTDAGTMQLDTFTAVESVTGDHINGVLFDNQGLYSVGSSVTTPGIDQARRALDLHGQQHCGGRQRASGGELQRLRLRPDLLRCRHRHLLQHLLRHDRAHHRRRRPHHQLLGQPRAWLRRRPHHGQRCLHRHRQRQICPAGCERASHHRAGGRRPECQPRFAHQRHGGIRYDRRAGRHLADRSVRRHAAAAADLAARLTEAPSFRGATQSRARNP